mmetsp:Transcript_88830/g.248637  ORF Transcript_88830/g.248637 Transcript_88830/m.248637 type:complete len:276 (-) Transcript_88830:52-879(-)
MGGDAAFVVSVRVPEAPRHVEAQAAAVTRDAVGVPVEDDAAARALDPRPLPRELRLVVLRQRRGGEAAPALGLAQEHGGAVPHVGDDEPLAEDVPHDDGRRRARLRRPQARALAHRPVHLVEAALHAPGDARVVHRGPCGGGDALHQRLPREVRDEVAALPVAVEDAVDLDAVAGAQAPRVLVRRRRAGLHTLPADVAEVSTSGAVPRPAHRPLLGVGRQGRVEVGAPPCRQRRVLRSARRLGAAHARGRGAAGAHGAAAHVGAGAPGGDARACA